MSSIAEAVRTSRSPQEALLVIAEALDRIEAGLAQQPQQDAWGWEPASESAIEAEVTDDEITVKLPPVDEQRKELRRKLAERIQLQEVFPEIEDAVEVYAKGGPMWLYLGSKEGRDYILGLPHDVKTAMVADVEQDSHKDAYDLARDILKDTDAQGPGFTMETLFGVKLDG